MKMCPFVFASQNCPFAFQGRNVLEGETKSVKQSLIRRTPDDFARASDARPELCRE